MSNEAAANTNTPSAAPRLCKMGCGFFGSDATGNCCSKCWMDSLKNRKESEPTAATAPAGEADFSMIRSATVMHCAVAMDTATTDDAMDITSSQPLADTVATAVPPAGNKTLRKKKKKTSYKNMMSSMMKQSTGPRDIRAERDTIQGLGGGVFSKVDKI